MPEVKNPPAKVGDIRDACSTSGLGRSPGGGIPTPVFLPGKSHRQRRLVGYSPWGSQRFGQLVKEKEIKRGEGISEGEEKKRKEIKGRRTKEGKIKNISSNRILIINKRLIRKVYQIHKTTVFSVVAFS